MLCSHCSYFINSNLKLYLCGRFGWKHFTNISSINWIEPSQLKPSSWSEQSWWFSNLNRTYLYDDTYNLFYWETSWRDVISKEKTGPCDWCNFTWWLLYISLTANKHRFKQLAAVCIAWIFHHSCSVTGDNWLSSWHHH